MKPPIYDPTKQLAPVEKATPAAPEKVVVKPETAMGLTLEQLLEEGENFLGGRYTLRLLAAQRSASSGPSVVADRKIEDIMPIYLPGSSFADQARLYRAQMKGREGLKPGQSNSVFWQLVTNEQSNTAPAVVAMNATIPPGTVLAQTQFEMIEGPVPLWRRALPYVGGGLALAGAVAGGVMLAKKAKVL